MRRYGNLNTRGLEQTQKPVAPVSSHEMKTQGAGRGLALASGMHVTTVHSPPPPPWSLSPRQTPRGMPWPAAKCPRGSERQA